jgi:hypothetical protein
MEFSVSGDEIKIFQVEEDGSLIMFDGEPTEAVEVVTES